MKHTDNSSYSIHRKIISSILDNHLTNLRRKENKVKLLPLFKVFLKRKKSLVFLGNFVQPTNKVLFICFTKQWTSPEAISAFNKTI